MAGTSVGEIGLDLVVNKNQFDKQMQGVTALAKKAATALAAAFSLKKLIDFGKECIELGSDLSEVQNVVDVTFPQMSAQVDEFAQNAASAFGLSETMAKQFTGTFGSMAKAFGFSEQEAYDMSTALTGLAGDVASFYNLEQDAAYTKLKSVFTGETESLKDLGVVMTQTALDSFALANGFGKTTSAMTEAEKVALRYQFVTEQLSAASGDFVRTSDGWANQVRVLSLQFDSLKATIGQGLINLFTPILKVINTLIGKLATLASAFKSFTEMITGNASDDGGMSGTTAGLLDATEAADALSDSAKQAAQDMKSLMGFDEISKVSETSSDEDSGSEESRSGISIGGVDFGSLASGATVVDELSGKLELLKNRFAIVKDYLVSKFRQPVADTLQGLKSEFSEFVSICGDAFSDMQTLGEPLGQWFDGPFTEYLQTALSIGGKTAAGIFDSFNMAFSDLWNIAVFPILQKFVGDGLPVITEFITESTKILGQAFDKIKAGFDTVWKDVAEPALEGISKLFNDCVDIVKSKWEQYGQPIFDKIREGIDRFGELCDATWNTILKPVWNAFMDVCTEVWDEHLKPLVDNFVDFCAVFAEGALDIYNRCIAPMQMWFVKTIGPAIKDFFANSIKYAGAFLSNIIDAIDGIITTFKGIIKFLTGVFTGDWKKAWEGIKDIASGIFKTLVSALKTPVNAIISIINGLVTGIVSGMNMVVKTLNNLSFKVPDWVPGLGGKEIGFNIPEITAPKIPYLAQGAYVRPNTPQLAMIGDNRHQGEFVAPEDKLLEMAKRAATMSGGGHDEEIIELLKQILAAIKALELVAYVDADALKRMVVKLINNHTRATGECEIIL